MSKKKADIHHHHKEIPLKTGEQTPHASSRRGFLKKAWLGLGAVAGLELLWMSFSFFSPKKKAGSTDIHKMKTAGELNNIPLNSVTPFRSGQFYLVRLADGGLLAMSMKCSHLACTVAWSADEERFICPCHASQFDIEGNVINPPAPRALDYFPLIVERGIVKVDTSRPIKRKVFEKSQLSYA